MILVFETLPTPGYGNDGRWLTVYMVPLTQLDKLDPQEREARPIATFYGKGRERAAGVLARATAATEGYKALPERAQGALWAESGRKPFGSPMDLVSPQAKAKAVPLCPGNNNCRRYGHKRGSRCR